ncbi:MAG: solute carrier family 23 protein [Methyloceanibacter sp.]|jgi:NCS2 family nucleobase:cation symporter-2/xanthine permease XanP
MAEYNPATKHLLYEVDDTPPLQISVTLAAQIVALILAGITLTPLVALNAAGLVDQWGNWVVFAALVISGSTTVLQALRVGPFGAGHILFMGTSGAFIAVSIAALDAGGLPLLGMLVLISSLVQFAVSARLSLFRSVVTPTVGGTIICMIAVTVMPFGFKMVSEVPVGFDNVAPQAPMWTAVATLAAIVLLSFYTSGKARLWAPLLGVLLGSAVAYPLGLINLDAVSNARWLGLPESHWPGLDLSFGNSFWMLLPAFVIVTIVGALETYGDGIAIQSISSRKVRTTDYRIVQGAINADGLGNLLSGLACTLPNTTYSTSISVVDLTGVASRRVGIYGGLMLVVLAFVPKLSALLQSIPAPVVGAFIIVLLVLLFAHGIRLVVSEGMSFDNGIVFGLSLWIGVGFQNRQLFEGLLPEFLANLLNNGMTAGGISAVLLSWLVSLKNQVTRKVTVDLSSEGLQKAMDFVSDKASRRGWRGEDLSRLLLVTEEAFVFVMEDEQIEAESVSLRLRVDSQTADLELVSSETEANVETLIRDLDDSTDDSEQLRLKILKHMVDELRHQQFSDADFLWMKLHRRDVPTRYN